MPQRIQLRRAKGWKMPPDTVKVDRSTRWGNPFITGVHGTQAQCVELYEMLMAGYVCLTMRPGNTAAQQAAHKHVEQHAHELRGKNLACWCRPGTPCHADILLRVANA